jgi:hypothetical protein
MSDLNTKLDLQIALAEYATNVIKYVPFNVEGDQEEEAYFYWLTDGNVVTDHEWDYIVWHLIARDITSDVHSIEGDQLCQQYHTNLEDILADYSYYSPHLKLNASWRTRALAYLRTVAKDKYGQDQSKNT